jgi:hypothetical protein
MKAPFCTLLALCLAASLGAQAPNTQYTPEQLDQLVGPIALYPDPLVALILPASTSPSDIGLAAQYIASGGNPAGIDSQPWDQSVKGLAHYPDVLNWMNDNLDWTQTLGAAFAMQPADVMKSIQQQRAKARANGTLVDTPQQRVDIEGDDIRIVPADPGTIYVPEYDADEVYDLSADAEGPFISFSVGYPVGPWLGFECDWDDYGIWFGHWRPGWDYRRDWRDARDGGSRWKVNPERGHELVRAYYRPFVTTSGPRPMPGARPEPNRMVALPRGSAPGERPGPPERQVQTERQGPPERQVQPEREPAAGRQPPAERPAPTARQAPVEHSTPDYRGYGAVAPKTPAPAPSGSLFGGYSRGTQTRDYSSRGQSSRRAPVRSAPSPRASSPEPSGKDRR